MLDIFRNEKREIGFVYLKGPPYRDYEGSQIRSCIHDAIINAAQRIGNFFDKLE